MAKNLETEIPWEETWERVQNTTGWRNYTQLANGLGIKTPNITKAKNRGFFPISWVFQIAKQLNISLDFLMLGNKSEEKSRGEIGKIDESLLSAVVEAVEEHLASAGLFLYPAKKAQLIVTLYDLFKEEGGQVDKAVVIRLTRLAA